MKAIILGFERGIRRLDSTESYPLALVSDTKGKRVLDWTLAALTKAGIDDIIFVGGYHIEKMVQLYPGMKFYYNPDWEDGSEIKAIEHVATELLDACLFVRSDIVFRPDIVKSFLDVNSDVVIGTNKCTDISNNELSSVYAGICALSGFATDKLRDQLDKWSQKCTMHGQTEIVNLLANFDLDTKYFDVSDGWAQIDSANSLSQFAFGTKAQTLERLQPLVRKSIVLEQIRFSAVEWRNDESDILDRIVSAMPKNRIIVRSSAYNEDTWGASKAGVYHSELGVFAQDMTALRDAINSVFDSLISVNGSITSKDEVFVQPHLDNVIMSGVLFTRDPQSGAPYVTINYDDATSLTDTVTSGQGKDLSTVIVYKYAKTSFHDDKYIAHLLDLVSELEELLGHDALDIEFAFDSSDNCYLLQVRVLSGFASDLELTDLDLHEELDVLHDYVDEITELPSHLLGNTTILANMPDWNPAEIIGVSPRPLALSLFQHLITDSVWSESRVLNGYQNAGHEPLVVSLSGHPYVDTRASLNSFLPIALESNLSHKLVEHCLKWLRNNPELHDKFEFEVAMTCLDFDFDKYSQRLLGDGFTRGEVDTIKNALLSLTDQIVLGQVPENFVEIEFLEQLNLARKQALLVKTDNIVSIVRTIDTLLKDCIKFGTLPFAIVARHAFISMSFLKSLRAKGVFSDSTFDSLLRSIPTVASDVTEDLYKLGSNELDIDEFIVRYGHLRPGTYDITCPSYLEAPERYLSNISHIEKPLHIEFCIDKTDSIIDSHQESIEKLIAEVGFSFDIEQLWSFIVRSIASRERIKFEYTKNISAVLTLVSELGEKYFEFSRDDMSYLPLQRILDLRKNSPSNVIKKELARLITLNRKRFSLHKSVRLPHMINSSRDIDGFELLKWQPNYVTSETIVGSVISVDQRLPDMDLMDKIVLIESADPGYDWLFGSGIIGLITKYGGSASHMAIRAAELGLPAAIGCGEIIYDQVIVADLIELDCAGQLVRVLR